MLVKKHDFIIIICTLFCGLGVLFINDPTVCLAIALIQTIMIFKKAKISLFSILAFLLNFCLIQEYGAYVGWDVYGLLAFKQVPIYFYEMFICVFSFNLILYCVLSISNCLENEGKLFTLNVDAGFQISVLLIIAAVGITFLMFPTIPSLGAFVLTNRFTRGILPFTGWSCMPPFFMAIAIMNERCRKCAIFVTVIIVFWYVFHGERVDCMGLLAFLAIKYYNNNRNNKNTIMKIGVIAGCVVVLFVAAGAVEFITCVKSIEDGYIHPTVGLRETEGEIDLNYTKGEGVHKDITYALSNSLGFGGHNASILVKKWEE